jgi:GAF domain-containing protein
MMRVQSSPEHEEFPHILGLSPENCVGRVLETVRSSLGMDVAFVSEFIGNTRFFRHVNTKTGRSPIKVGDSAALEDGYCKKIVEGRLPELIPDTAVLPEAMSIAATREMPIGSHLSVPLRLGDGRIYGTFCCFSFEAGPTLNQRDLLMMKAFADVVVYQIDGASERVRNRVEKTERIQAALLSEEPSIVYQPVFRLSDMTVVAAEALARFGGEPTRSPISGLPRPPKSG